MKSAKDPCSIKELVAIFKKEVEAQNAIQLPDTATQTNEIKATQEQLKIEIKTDQKTEMTTDLQKMDANN